jgi:hypothetical protein
MDLTPRSYPTRSLPSQNLRSNVPLTVVFYVIIEDFASI